MKNKVVCTVVVSLFLLSTMLMPTIQKVKAEDTTALHVDPSKSCAPVGELFSINASIFNVTNLNTWRFDLEWDANLLEVPDDPTTNGTVEGVTEGSFLNQNNTLQTVWVSKMRNENTLSVTCALKGVKAYDAPSGSGTLATVTFLVKAEGESPLHFNFTRLLRYYSDVDPIPIEIPHISEGGYFDNRIPFKVFNVVWKDIHYSVSTLSNSTVTHFVFNQTLAQISFNVTGEYGTIGYCNATIPKSLLSGNWTIRIDNTTVTPTIAGNDTHSFLHLTYTHTSTLRVTIRGTWVIPEFPSFLILPLFMITTLLAVIFYRRKHPMRH